MRRREFITFLGGAAAMWPLAARAQQSDRVRRIGVLLASTADDQEFRARLAAFTQALTRLGWSDGQNLRIDIRWATADDSCLIKPISTVPPFVPGLNRKGNWKMSKRDLSDVASLLVVATPAPGGAGRFEARLGDDDRVLCLSRTPFFDAARKLLAEGYDPNDLLMLRHGGSDTNSLRAKLGTAASLTVKETGYGPQLQPWKPFSTLPVRARNAPADRTATTPILHPAAQDRGCHG
jgi:hypothetical protein